MATTYEPIASQTLGSNTTTVTFDNIPGTYTDLRFVFVGKYVSAVNNFSFRLNDDTGSNYSFTQLFGNGTSASSARASSQAFGRYGTISNSAISTVVVDFMAYSNTSVFKTILSQTSAADFRVHRDVVLWRSTSAITKILMGYDGADFQAGSTFSLYGIKSA